MKTLFKLTVFYILLIVASRGYGSPVTVSITFLNQTNKDVVQTAEPYLDNYSSFLNAYYHYLAPYKTFSPGLTNATSLSYEWALDWYGGSQFAYNYAGRSKNYGCFVTDIRFSGSSFTRNSNVVIASFVKDPAYPNDYLTCTVEPKENTTEGFTVRFAPSTEDKAKDDSKRFTMAGDTSLLNKTSSYGIDLPITLNPQLKLYPDTAQPELTRNDFVAPSPLEKYATTIKVVNHTNRILVAGTPVLDRQTRFSSNDFVDQPQEILPVDTKNITISSSAYEPDHMQRFNYHIKGYAENSGCYVSGKLFDGYYYASYYLDPQHKQPEPNLYCIMKDQNTVEIYDYFDFDAFQNCNASTNDQEENCISYGSGKFLVNLSLNSCGYGYSFDLDPIHKIQVSHIPCRYGA